MLLSPQYLNIKSWIHNAQLQIQGLPFDPAWSHIFVEIDHEIISTATVLLQLVEEELLSLASKSMSTKYWLAA